MHTESMYTNKHYKYKPQSITMYYIQGVNTYILQIQTIKYYHVLCTGCYTNKHYKYKPWSTTMYYVQGVIQINFTNT